MTQRREIQPFWQGGSLAVLPTVCVWQPGVLFSQVLGCVVWALSGDHATVSGSCFLNVSNCFFPLCCHQSSLNRCCFSPGCPSWLVYSMCIILSYDTHFEKCKIRSYPLPIWNACTAEKPLAFPFTHGSVLWPRELRALLTLPLCLVPLFPCWLSFLRPCPVCPLPGGDRETRWRECSVGQQAVQFTESCLWSINGCASQEHFHSSQKPKFFLSFPLRLNLGINAHVSESSVWRKLLCSSAEKETEVQPGISY